MGRLSSRQRWSYFVIAIAVEYGCLFLAFWFSFTVMGAEPSHPEIANFLLGCAFIAVVFGWLASLPLLRNFWDLLVIEVPLLAPIIVTGIVARNDSDYVLTVTCLVLVVGFMLPALQNIRRSEPTAEPSPGSQPKLGEVVPWAEYLAPHLGVLRALAFALIALVVLLGVGGAIAQRIHAPVTETSLLASVLEEAGDSYTMTDDARCFDVEMVDWLCAIDDTSRSGAYDFYVDVEPGGSCWTATINQAFGQKPPPSRLSGCVHRFPRGWSGVFGR